MATTPTAISAAVTPGASVCEKPGGRRNSVNPKGTGTSTVIWKNCGK